MTEKTETVVDKITGTAGPKEKEAFGLAKNNRLVIGLVALIVLLMVPQLIPLALLLLIAFAVLRYRVKGSL